MGACVCVVGPLSLEGTDWIFKTPCGLNNAFTQCVRSFCCQLRLQAERKIPSAFGRHLVGQLGLYRHTQLPASLGAGVRLHTCPGFMPRLLHAGGEAGNWVLHGFDTELWDAWPV